MASLVAGRVSVLIPCYNAARFLREAIESALAQTYGDVEIAVTDDGSTDDSRDVLTSYGARVRLLEQRNRGPAAARNRALAVATGEYVSFLDADDRFHPGKLERQVEVLRRRPDVGLVYCGWRLVDADGREYPEQGWPRLEGDLFPRLLLANLFHPVSVVVRSNLLRAVGGFDEALMVNEDWDLLLRLSRAGARWACVGEVLCDYRIHPGQSHERLRLVHDTTIAILDRMFAEGASAADLAPLRPRAYAEAYVRGAADFYRAGLEADADRAIACAGKWWPDAVADSRNLQRFLRLSLPDGYRGRAELSRRRGQMIGRGWRAMRQGSRHLVARDRLRAHGAFTVIAGRLLWRAVRSVLGLRDGGAPDEISA